MSRSDEPREGLVGLAPAASSTLVQLSDALVALSTGAEPSSTLDLLVDTAAEHIPGARWTSVTTLRQGRFSTDAASHDTARRVDAIQYEVGSGPCIDAALEDHVFVTGDLPRDDRWPAFATKAAEESPVRSVFAQRLTLHGHVPAIASLNVYSDAAEAFDEAALGVGLVLATHASLLVTATLERQHARNLERALQSNREIGVAMGILMQRHRITRDQAFHVLRVASQDSNRKLAEIATEVADTGTITMRRWPLPPAAPSR